MPHRIRRQILDLELPREERAYALQQQISQAFKDKVLPQLNEIFDAIAPEGITLRIPKLDIDLGQINETNWERNFIEGCVNQVLKKLKDVSVDNTYNEVELKWLKPEEKILSVFRHYLQAGVLPWHARHWSNLKLEESIIQYIHRDPEAVKKELSIDVLLIPEVWQRLCWQFSTNFVTTIVSTVLGQKVAWFNEIEHIYKKEQKVPMSSKDRYLFLKTLLSTKISKEEKLKPTKQIYYQLLRQIGDSKNIKENEVIEREKPMTSANYFSQNNDTVIPEKNETPRSGASKKNSSEPQGKINPDKQKEGHIQYKDTEYDTNTAFSKPASATTIHLKTIPKEGLIIDLAGLVILGVYLESLFNELGLIHERHFKSDNAQFKAAHLLYYLVEGTEFPEEHVLAFPKILCGLAIVEPIPMDIKLQDYEKKECEQLLQAAIRNWPALKKTTPDGLREGFLKREGLLYPPENLSMWVLRVENKAQDILLNRLPWGFLTLKLPWMKRAIQTEWSP